MLNTETGQSVPSPASPLAQWLPEHGGSGVSWAAIFAGAAAAAALSLILVILGFGLGFSAVSPWPSRGASATAITVATALWLALTQIVASGLGGYLAGRLRVKWTTVHADEVYFRDTAHGLLSWAVATLVTAAFLGSALTGLIGSGARAAGTAASSALSLAQGAAAGADHGRGDGALSYLVDSLFRTDQPDASHADPAQAQREAAGIFLHDLGTGTLDAGDKAYLGKLVARRTGLSEADAEKRVDDVYARARQTWEQSKTKAMQAADAARKAAMGTALWTFIALLCGAFFASLTAIWGGRRRERAVIDSVGVAAI